jgi:glycosyltransferase involved in cell wall biosynthesis
MEEPSIAVIMPVRNGLPFLSGAIQCVERQSYSPLELVIVDDGSSDGSLEAARKAGARILQTRGVGPAAARNAGIRQTVSDTIAFLDVDDLWPPRTLRRLAAELAANPQAGFAQGLIQNFRVLEDGSNRFFTAPYRFVNLGASLYRRSLFDTVGLLDETLQLCEDLDFLMRCWEKDISRALVNEVTLHYRRHPRNMTAGLDGAGFGTVQAIKRRIDRIRGGLYDPKQPRRVPAIDYIGVGPENQDGEVALWPAKSA